MWSQRGTLHSACRELSYEPCRILVWWEFQVGKAKATNKLEYQLIASEPPPTSPRRKCPHTTTSTQCATCQGILGCLLGVDTALCQPLWFVCLWVFSCFCFGFVVVFCFLPAATAPGFWLSSEERFGSILECLPAVSVAFLFLLDIARIFLC